MTADLPLAVPYDGPDPGHPVGVVPEDPGRRGALVRVRGWEVAVADPVAEVTDLQALAAAAEAEGWADERVPDPARPPFGGGLLGVVTDDVSLGVLGLPTEDDRPAPAPLPPVWFGRYDHAACRAPDGRWWLAAETRVGLQAADALLRRRSPASRTSDLSAAKRDDARTSDLRPGGRGVEPTLDRAAHAEAVRQIQAWIAAGDVYQVNLTLHVHAAWPGSPRTLALRLFGASPVAAHAAFLHAPGGTIASVSPETFLRTDGRRAAVRPIKGTRRRHPDPAEDRRLAADLQAAAKDAAEHVMIVDLERNDLGRISRTGTVSVPELMALEAHPTVWHLTSTVTGHLREEVGFGDVLAALFPCGSVTGAPKRMAVDRTRLVEPWRRGAYCGAVGVIARGLVDLSVAIRTAVVHDGRAWYGTGGGITADSDPDEEWDEAMGKAAAFLTAVAARTPSARAGRPTPTAGRGGPHPTSRAPRPS